MTRWPNFFIVGAARAGTTSLYHYLREHPDTYMPPIKEPHFFSRVDPHAERLRYFTMKVITKEEDYLQLFKGATTEAALGEASPSYLHEEGTSRRIKEKTPEAKVIILLREPIDRAYSQYLADVREGAQRQPFYEALMEDFARPRKVWGVAHLYAELGLYYDQVKRYLDAFGSEQVRIYLYEELASDPSGVVRDVCTFLGVPFYDGNFFDPGKRYNTYAAPRSTLFNRIMGTQSIRSLAISLVPKQLLIPLRNGLLLAKGAKPPMDPRARAFLRSIYAADIIRLQDLIGRDLHAWISESNGNGHCSIDRVAERRAGKE